MAKKKNASEGKTLSDHLQGKSPHTIALFHHFVKEYKKLGDIEVLPAKTMIGIATPRKRIVYIIQLGKNFIDVVFPFKQPYADNLCFLKIAQVPGEQQFNHHFRMISLEDVNEEVRGFMQMAYKQGS